MADIVIKDVSIITSGTRGKFYKNVDLIIAEGKIEKISSNSYSTPSAEHVIDGKGKLALPGFINSHVHIEETLGMNTIPETTKHIPWFERYVLPYYTHMEKEDYYYSDLFSHLLMLRAGITCSADSANRDPGSAARAADKSGIRQVIAKWCCDIGAYLSTSIENCLNETEELLKKYNKEEDTNKRVSAIAAVIGLNQCSDNLYLGMKELSQKYRVPITTHEASGHEDVARSLKRVKERPIEHLAKIGFLSSHTLVSHATDCNDNEVQQIKRYDSSVVLCPAAELKKGKGLWKYGRVRDFIRKNVNICLGTDTANSSNHLNVLKACNLFLLLTKDYCLDPSQITSEKGLDMITLNAAEALGLKRVGILKEGYAADIAIFDLKNSLESIMFNGIQSMMYGSQNDTYATIVDGKVVYENGEYPQIDSEKVVRETMRRRERLLGKLGLQINSSKHGT